MIPEGWERTAIGEHVDVLTGYAFKSSDYSDGPDDIRLLRGDNVAQHRIRWRDAKKLPLEKARGLDRFALKLGDFVIALDRTWIPAGVKIAEITEADLPSLLVQRVARLRSKPSLEQALMRQFFSGHGFEQHVKSVQTETAVPHISPNDLRDLAILLPPLPEQKRIAETLQTWDRAIETVEALIANARAQKQALMQQLLPQGTTPPKKRLPGFSGEWRETTIESVASVLVSNVDKKSVIGERPVRLCNYMDVYRSDQIVSDMDFMAATATEAQIRKFGLKVGDVIITKDSETPDDIAIPTIVQSTAPDLVCGYHLTILRPKDGSDGQFLKFFFEHPRTRHFFASRANGATRFGLTVGAIETAPISLPSHAEQKEIGNVILATETEIHRLKPILTALRQEKAALMQQLLTGKRRVKLQESEVA